MDNQNIVGTWTLVSVTIRSTSGTEISPFGNNPVGQIIYTHSGEVSIMIMRPDRTIFSGGDAMSGTPEEVREAFEGFDAYCGSYSVDEEISTVTHHIEACRFPNWVGTDQLRHFTLSGNHLELTAPPIEGDGQEWTATLVWKRK